MNITDEPFQTSSAGIRELCLRLVKMLQEPDSQLFPKTYGRMCFYVYVYSLFPRDMEAADTCQAFPVKYFCYQQLEDSSLNPI